MTDLKLEISDPISLVIRSAADVLVAIITASVELRDTMSQGARDEDDKIRAQIYWDWRHLLQITGVVGPPK